MNHFADENPTNRVNDTKAEVIKKMRADGLIDNEGNLKLDVIEGIQPVDESNNSISGLNSKDRFSQVIGSDTRTEVVDKRIPPYNSIVLLIMKYNNKLYRGTGFLIKDNIVLTAAHNIYDLNLKKSADDVYIIGEPKDAAHIRTYTKLKISPDYASEKSNNDRYDWGLIKMNDAMSDLDTINVLQAADVSPSTLNDVLIAGYPGAAQGNSTKDMWEANGDVTYYNANEVMAYTISTSPGNSGSPVMIYDHECRTAIGIHVSGSANFNYAKAIDNDVIAAINAFN